jgi:hypothetical protein
VEGAMASEVRRRGHVFWAIPHAHADVGTAPEEN